MQNCQEDRFSAETEDVLVVPKKLTKRAFELLTKASIVPRPFHLEGRYGSRTHRLDDEHMGIPIISKETLHQAVEKFPELKLQEQILDNPQVSVQRLPVTVVVHRARDPPDIDATIHPERAPQEWKDTDRLPQKISQVLDSDSSLNLSVEGVIHQQIEKEVEENGDSKEPAFTYAELFGGIGGFGVALEALGGTCLFYSELEEPIRDVYKLNFDTDPQCIHGDIYKVSEADLPKEVDLLCAGFPCQPFSSLGEQPGFDCPKGSLFLEIVRFLKYSNCKAFLLENVQGLLGMKEFESIVEALKNAGYEVSTEVVSARGLTATNRKRLFFVGYRTKEEEGAQEVVEGSGGNGERDSSILDKKMATFEFPYIPDLKLRAGDVLDYDSADRLDLLRLAETTMTQLLTGKRFRPASMAWPNVFCRTLTSEYDTVY